MFVKSITEKEKYLELGDISAKIDWGYAKEYTENAWKIMQQKNPDYFIIATGQVYSVKEFMIKCFKFVGLDWKKYLKINKKFFRPTKTSTLIGNTNKAKKVFNFKIKYKLDDLIKVMMESELNK